MRNYIIFPREMSSGKREKLSDTIIEQTGKITLYVRGCDKCYHDNQASKDERRYDLRYFRSLTQRCVPAILWHPAPTFMNIRRQSCYIDKHPVICHLKDTAGYFNSLICPDNT